jgi:hypothetical protein
MAARLAWNEGVLVIESEAVCREAVGCIAWLGLEATQKYIGSDSINYDGESEAHKKCEEV